MAASTITRASSSSAGERERTAPGASSGYRWRVIRIGGASDGGTVVAVRASASCSALSGSISPEPKLSSRSPGECRRPHEARMNPAASYSSARAPL